MATQSDSTAIRNQVAALRAQLAGQAGSDLLSDPRLADALTREVDQLMSILDAADQAQPRPPDGGLAELAGIGDESARHLGTTRVPLGVEGYDETVASERILAVADLYYIYQHERVGVWRAVRKLQELFKAGTVRLSSGDGAFALYQFDRRDVLRFTRADRLAAYRRAFGYGAAPLAPGARPNADFHPLFTHFNNQVALYWRDKRISDVIRERAYDPSFGSVAVVRRSGLDLRNNLKFASFGHLNVLRVELMQVLEEAFTILGSPDVKRLFGADSAWDVLEEVLLRYFNQRVPSSARQRMAVAGRAIMQWLAQAHVLQQERGQFEALLLEIAEYAEEWITSAQSVGVARRATDVTERVRRAPLASRPLSRPPAATVPVPGGMG
jgi:hypothetical protein